MPRRRYLSTEISTDLAVSQLAEECGDFAALFYTWLIPHAEDNGCVCGDIGKIMLLVIPGFRWKSKEDIANALEGMHRLGLVKWDHENKVIQFPASFYKYQKYISEKRRVTREPLQGQEADGTEDNRAGQRNSAQSDADSRNARKSAQKSASFMFRFKSSKDQNTCVCSPEIDPNEQDLIPPAENPPVKGEGARESGKGNEYPEEFEVFWYEYPRRREKAKAFRCWKTERKRGSSSEEMIMAARNYAVECRAKRIEERYIKHGATFLGPDRPWIEYVRTLAGRHEIGSNLAESEASLQKETLRVYGNERLPEARAAPPRKNDYNAIVIGAGAEDQEVTSP